MDKMVALLKEMGATNVSYEDGQESNTLQDELRFTFNNKEAHIDSWGGWDGSSGLAASISTIENSESHLKVTANNSCTIAL